jgi:MraZ protein
MKWEDAVGPKMFRGKYETTVDEKGRTSLPSKFRDNLVAEDDKRLFLTATLEPCLKVYPYTRFLEFEKKLNTLPSFDPAVALLKRLTISGAVECRLDTHGRILVPPNLRVHAGIDKDVLWSGMSDHAELWDIARFQKATEIAPGQVEALAKALAALGL